MAAAGSRYTGTPDGKLPGTDLRCPECRRHLWGVAMPQERVTMVPIAQHLDPEVGTVLFCPRCRRFTAVVTVERAA